MERPALSGQAAAHTCFGENESSADRDLDMSLGYTEWVSGRSPRVEGDSSSAVVTIAAVREKGEWEAS